MQERVGQGGMFQLLPLFVFVGLFAFSPVLFSAQISPIPAVIIALMISFLTFTKPTTLHEKIGTFIKGGSRPTVVTLFYIFVLASIFSYTLEVIGGTKAVVSLTLFCIPQSMILPGMFLAVSLFSIAVGTSIGAIVTFLPVGIGLSQQMGLDLSLVGATIIGSAVVGDNLSLISDTTIAAVQTTGANMKDKFKMNMRLALPALLLTLVTLGCINFFTQAVTAFAAPVFVVSDVGKILPYGTVLMLALMGMEVISVLTIAIFMALGIGIVYGTFTLYGASHVFMQAFSSNHGNMHKMILLVFLIGGLSYIVEYNGGIRYILQKYNHKVKSKGSAEFSIGFLVACIDAVIAIGAVSILISGPVVKSICNQYNINASRSACIVDLFSCLTQSLLPYAPQMLITSSMTGLSVFSIYPHMYYHFFMWTVLFASITRTFFKNKNIQPAQVAPKKAVGAKTSIKELG